MPIEQALIVMAGNLVGIVVLAGMIARQRLSRCLGFTLYLSSVVITSLLAFVQPRILEFESWRALQILYTSLRHLMALELAFHTFRAFPAARRLARSFLWITSVLALAAPFMFDADFSDWASVILHVLPRMNLAAVGLFAGLGVLILWYRLPLDPMHKAIIMGIVPYLTLYNLLLLALRDFGNEYNDVLNFANALAWLVVTVFWAWVAWRPRPRRRHPDDTSGSLGAMLP